MSYRIPLPAGGHRLELDVVDPFSSMVQRFLRREGLAAYEPETATTLLALFDSFDRPFTFVDVGANIGLYSHLCAAMFPEASVHALEPTPSTVAIARSIAASNDLSVEVIAVAASDTAGTAELHLSQTSDASNSLVDGFKPSVQRVAVPSVRLDDLRPSFAGPVDVLKIDVETHEPQVLAGAVELLAADRPYVIVEVLRRRREDQGQPIQAAFDGLGYHYYPLTAAPTWEAQQTITGSGTIERDWLLAPHPVDEEFAMRWTTWAQRWASCTTDRNSRPPIGGAAMAAYRRGGPGELYRSGRRFLREDVAPTMRKTVDRMRRVASRNDQR